MIDNNSKEFIYRHIGPTEAEQKSMLKDIGYNSLDELMKNTVPEKILLKDELNIEEPLSENDALKKLKTISKQNKIFRNFIGMGYYFYLAHLFHTRQFCYRWLEHWVFLEFQIQ